MTAPPALPTLPGLSWSRHKKPGFSTRVASHISGREVRVALMSYPLYEFEAIYHGLASSLTAAFAGLGSSSLQSLMGFFMQMQGQANTFLYTDPDDSTITGGAIGTGDGTTQTFVIGRALGGWNEPVSWVTAVANVYLNGVLQSSGNWLFIAPNSIVFGSAPGAGVAITTDFTFAFQCRFLDDQMDFEEFMSSLWKLDSMKFRSITANTMPAAVPAPTVTGISPSSGSTSGGTSVTITGMFFGGATSVTIGGVACTGATVVNSTTITATTGANSAGVDNVVVITPAGTGAGVGLYTYSAWYTPYAIGSTLPLMFADPTTEGGTNHYIYNGTTYTSFSAWLTAVSGTFSRSSSKYITNSSGNLASISSGVLPFDYSPTSVGTSNGLLLEPASTNLLTYSQAIASWAGATGYGATPTNNVGIAPDGTNTATAVISTTANSQHFSAYVPLTCASGLSTTLSAYFKADGYSYGALAHYNGGSLQSAVINTATGAVTATFGSGFAATGVLLANGWVRLSLTFTTSYTTDYIYLGMSNVASPSLGGNSMPTFTGDGTSGVLAWGVQYEPLPFASSYIPTTSSTASRAADSLKIPWTSATATFIVKTINQTYAAGASVDLLATNTNSNGDQLLAMGSSTSLSTIDSSTTLTKTAAVTSWASSNITGVSGNSSGRALTANNETPAADSNPLFTATPSNIWLGGGNAAAPACGDISQFRAFNIAATSTQLQAQTNLA